MRHSTRTIVQMVLPFLVAGLLPLPAVAEGPPAEEGARIAAISGVHAPHQGFALSASVPSDRMCLELAQNLASELGIVVHVICTDPAGGLATIVAECGYASKRDARRVGIFSRGWLHTDDSFLMCVPPDPNRFPAQRIAPDLDALRPVRSPRS